MDERDSFSGPVVGGDLSRKPRDPTKQRDDWIADAEPESVRTTVDSGAESTGVAVVSAVAAVSNTVPRELEPLHDVLDVDALDTIFQPGSDGSITFRYGGCEVVVRSDSDITVAPETGR